MSDQQQQPQFFALPTFSAPPAFEPISQENSTALDSNANSGSAGGYLQSGTNTSASGSGVKSQPHVSAQTMMALSAHPGPQPYALQHGNQSVQSQGQDLSQTSQGSQPGQEGDPETEQRNLYVTRLAPTVTEDTLKAVFSKFGTIQSLKLMLDIHTGQSRGFAFILFDTKEAAHSALAGMDHEVLEGQRIDVRFAKGPTKFYPGVPTRKVFLRNLPLDIGEEQLRAIFEPQFRVMQVSIQRDSYNDGAPKNAPLMNIAHIIFYSVEDAQEASAKVHRTRPFPTCTTPVLAKVVDTSVRATKADRQSRQSRSRGSDNSFSASASLSSTDGVQFPAPPPPPNMVQFGNPQQVQGMPMYVTPQGQPIYMMPQQQMPQGGLPQGFMLQPGQPMPNQGGGAQPQFFLIPAGAQPIPQQQGGGHQFQLQHQPGAHQQQGAPQMVFFPAQGQQNAPPPYR